MRGMKTIFKNPPRREIPEIKYWLFLPCVTWRLIRREERVLWDERLGGEMRAGEGEKFWREKVGEFLVL